MSQRTPIFGRSLPLVLGPKKKAPFVWIRRHQGPEHPPLAPPPVLKSVKNRTCSVPAIVGMRGSMVIHTTTAMHENEYTPPPSSNTTRQAFPGHAKLQRQACWALLTLAANDEISRMIASEGGVGAIIAAMINNPR